MRSVAAALPRSTPKRQQRRIFWAVLAVVSAVAVFILPLWFPPQIPTYSASYAVGFNNRVAAVAAILLSLVTAALCLRQPSSITSTQPPVHPPQPMPSNWAWAASLLVTIYVAVLGGVVLQTDSFESDSAYFLTQLAKWSHFHLKLYRDLEFGYGPLLFAWPALVQRSLGRLGVSPEAAYLVALAVVQVLGLWLTFYFINGLRLRRSIKGWLLLALTIGTMRPSLGLNYTLFRFVTPFAALLYVSTRVGKGKQTTLFAIAQLLMLSISPEIGLSFFVGICFYCCYRAYEQRPSWLAVPLLPLLAAVIFGITVDSGYFYTMRQFSTGMLNMVVSPTPDTLALLIATVALAPLSVARAIRRKQPHAASLVAVYGASLSLLPAALGLCDNLHVFFNGLGLFSLSLLAVSEAQPLWSAVALLVLISMATPNQVQSVITALASRPTQRRTQIAELAQVRQWENQTNGQSIYAPAGLPVSMRNQLLADGRWQPGRFSGMDNAFSPGAEEIKWRELRQATFVLVPQGNLLPPIIDERRRMRLLRFWYRYRVIRRAYSPLASLRAKLLVHSEPLGTADPYSGLRLYRIR